MPLPTKEEFEFETELDINDPSLMEGDVQEYDLSEDFQARSAPPPKARYKVRLFADDEKIERGLKQGFKPTDANGFYYKKAVSAKIQDPSGKWQDSVVTVNFSTGVPKGKKISSMLGMLQYLKVKVAPKMTELAVAKLFIKALQKLDGPVAIGDFDWQGWDKTATSRGQELGSIALLAETGKFANTMLNFPKKADGTYNHIATTKKGVEINAKLKLVKWVEMKPAAGVNGAAKPVSAPSQLAKPVQQAAKPVASPASELEIETEGTALEMGDDGEVVLEF